MLRGVAMESLSTESVAVEPTAHNLNRVSGRAARCAFGVGEPVHMKLKFL
jgi:hypothetical protein